MEEQLPAGVYRHFKGNHYLVLGLARHTETGEELSWDENISSVVVRGGTWRLCEASDFNRVSGGWSTLVSAGMHGELRQSASECGGWTNDSISSIQLVSEGGMEDWAILNREARRRR